MLYFLIFMLLILSLLIYLLIAIANCQHDKDIRTIRRYNSDGDLVESETICCNCGQIIDPNT